MACAHLAHWHGLRGAAWTGIGATGSVLLGILFFNESRDPARLVSIGLIIAGIVGLRLTTTAE